MDGVLEMLGLAGVGTTGDGIHGIVDSTDHLGTLHLDMVAGEDSVALEVLDGIVRHGIHGLVDLEDSVDLEDGVLDLVLEDGDMVVLDGILILLDTGIHIDPFYTEVDTMAALASQTMG